MKTIYYKLNAKNFNTKLDSDKLENHQNTLVFLEFAKTIILPRLQITRKK
jgi:hypothetical protein